MVDCFVGIGFGVVDDFGGMIVVGIDWIDFVLCFL